MLNVLCSDSSTSPVATYSIAFNQVMLKSIMRSRALQLELPFLFSKVFGLEMSWFLNMISLISFHFKHFVSCFLPSATAQGLDRGLNAQAKGCRQESQHVKTWRAPHF